MSGQKGQTVGYVRVSTVEQNEQRQVAALGETDRTFLDKASGRTTSRPGLEAMLEYVRTGDTVRVKSPDRLARSTRDLLKLVETLSEEGVGLEFVDAPALNTDSAQGQFMLTILAAVAELEAATIRERQAEGIALAKARGVYERVPLLSEAQVKEMERDIAAGTPKAVVARRFGCSRQTLYAALNRQGGYASYPPHKGT